MQPGPSKFLLRRVIVLPGVGHFSAFVEGLREKGLTSSLRTAYDAGVPILGICLGLQAFFVSSEEAPGEEGLGFLPGEVRALPKNVKSPHIGWNQLERLQPSKLLRGIPEDAFFYFAHSYAAPAAGTPTVAACNHGFPFAAVIEQAQPDGRAISPGKIRRRGRRAAEQFSGGRSMTCVAMTGIR